MSTFLKKCTVLTKPVFVYEIVWRQDYRERVTKLSEYILFLLGVFIFRLKRLEDHQERNKCKFPRLCPGGYHA